MNKVFYALATLFLPAALHAADPIELEYHASLTAQASSQRLAPYMIGSWNQGRYSQGNGIWQEGGIFKELNMNRRFSWGAGFEYIVGVGSEKAYDR